MDKSPPKRPTQGSQDPFARVKPAESESTLEVLKAYEQDKSATKFNLMPSISGEMPNRIYTFDVTQKAQREVIEANLDKDYIHMIGDANLNTEARKLIFGDRLTALGEKITTVASVSGSNSFRIIMEFFKQSVGKDVYLPNSGWESYSKICKKVGLKTKTYHYFDFKKKCLDFDGICKSLKAAPSGSIVVLHSSAYNPTGIEPSVDQWKTLATIFKEKSLYAVFDSVGQGLVSGDINKDNISIQTFLEQEVQVTVCQSLSSSLGIYGEKVGSLHVVCGSKEVAVKVLEQLKLIIRTMHANPPCNGEWIALKVLKEYRPKWEAEVKQAANKSRQLRKVIYDELKEFGDEGQWEYLLNHEGPFCHLEFSRKQRDLLRNRYHIYVAENGNINLENIEVKDVNYVTEAFRSALAIPSSQF